MTDPKPAPYQQEPPYVPQPPNWTFAIVVIAFTAASLLYRMLIHADLGHSAAMFLGVPAVLAILLSLAPKARSVTGGIVKGITLALLVLAPLLGEGYLCILMAAPLFYLVGVTIGLAVDHARQKRKATLSCTALLLLPMCLEGVVPGLHFDRAQIVEVTRTVAATPAEVEAALSRSPRLETRLPGYLRIGFPTPLAAWGEGLRVGDTRTIHFTGAEGDPPGDLSMRVTERRPGYVRFASTGDTSKLTQWIRWQSSEVEWVAADPAHTAVTWRIRFDRQLDPAWYFIPWERSAVHEAAAYLIDANATPVRP